MKSSVAVLLLCMFFAVLYYVAGGTTLGDRPAGLVEQASRAVTGLNPVASTPTPASSVPAAPRTLPQTTVQALALFGGDSAASWTPMSPAGNGWVYRGALAHLSIPDSWRVDYTGADGHIYSCGDNDQPGAYGPTDVMTAAAMLWFVPGEITCPAWSVWSAGR